MPRIKETFTLNEHTIDKKDIEKLTNKTETIKKEIENIEKNFNDVKGYDYINYKEFLKTKSKTIGKAYEETRNFNSRYKKLDEDIKSYETDRKQLLIGTKNILDLSQKISHAKLHSFIKFLVEKIDTAVNRYYDNHINHMKKQQKKLTDYLFDVNDFEKKNKLLLLQNDKNKLGQEENELKANPIKEYISYEINAKAHDLVERTNKDISRIPKIYDEDKTDLRSENNSYHMADEKFLPEVPNFINLLVNNLYKDQDNVKEEDKKNTEKQLRTLFKQDNKDPCLLINLGYKYKDNNNNTKDILLVSPQEVNNEHYISIINNNEFEYKCKIEINQILLQDGNTIVLNDSDKIIATVNNKLTFDKDKKPHYSKEIIIEHNNNLAYVGPELDKIREVSETNKKLTIKT